MSDRPTVTAQSPHSPQLVQQGIEQDSRSLTLGCQNHVQNLNKLLYLKNLYLF